MIFQGMGADAGRPRLRWTDGMTCNAELVRPFATSTCVTRSTV
jgi:hypothetical protein